MNKNIFERAIKTFVESFFGMLVPELSFVLSQGFPESWSAFWAIIAPVLAGAIGAGISATWNYIETKIKENSADNSSENR